MNDYAQPWRVMQDVDSLLMKTTPWSERLEQIGHSLLRLLDSDAVWLLTSPPISGIACGVIRSPLPRDPNACVIFTDLAPPPIFSDADSSTAQALRAGVPRLINEDPFGDGHLDNDLADALLRTLQVRPSLIVPLLVGSEPVGVMVVADRDGPSKTLPTSILQAIGEHLGVALQSAYLRDASRRQAEALAALNRIAHTLTSSLDIEEVVQRTMASINQILDVEAGSLLLVDEDTDELYFKIALRGEHKSITAFRLQMGQGIAGWVAAHGLPALVNDVSTDPRFYGKIDEATGFKTRSVLCAPLIIQGQPTGALEVINKRQGYFTADDQELLISMCASLAIALENASLYREAREQGRRTAIINDITSAINASPSLPQASQAIAAHLYRLVPFDYATVCFLDDSTRYLNVYYLAQETGRDHQPSLTIPFEGSGLEWIIQHAHARIANLEEEELSLSVGMLPDFTARQMVSVPMVAQNKVRGVINLISNQADAYSQPELETLAQIAPQLSIAFEKARLFDLMEQRTASLQALNQMGQQLASTTDASQVLSIALSFMSRLIPGDIHALLILDEDGGQWGVTLPFVAQEAFLDEIIEEMIGALTPVFEIDDQAPMRREVISGQDPMPANWAPVTKLTLPIISHLGLTGIAYLASSKMEDVAGETLRIYSLVVSKIAAAIENASLFREVERERARLEAFLSSTTNLIIVVDRAHRIVLANPAARDVFGQGQTWESRPLSEAVHNQALLELFGKAQRNQAIFGEVPLSDGRTFRASLSPISSGDQQIAGWVVAMQDVTYLKELDQMKTDFMNAVSHDLRSPLSGIAIATHMVSKMGEVTPNQHSLLKTIEDRVSEMTELIDGMLDLARIEANIDIELEPCAISPIISKVVSQLAPQIRDKDLQIDVEAGSNLPPVMGDALRLRQVLSNLINNAVKYTLEGGRISIAATCSQDEIVVSIQDTGIGVPPADQPFIFDKFYRVGRPEIAGTKGAGLGLAIARSIVERLGGRIWVQSELNAGSTFSFALPIIKEDPDRENWSPT